MSTASRDHPNQDEPERHQQISNRGEAVQTPGPGSRDTDSGQNRESDMDASLPGSAKEDDRDQDGVELPSPSAILRFTLLPVNEIALGESAKQ